MQFITIIIMHVPHTHTRTSTCTLMYAAITPPPSSTPVITYQLSSYLALNQVPTSGQLSHVNELSETGRQQTGYRAGTITPVTIHSLYIGGLPPIPQKLIRRIQDGHFINMAELLPDNLEATNSTDDDHTINTKCKHQEVTQIMDWIQYFSTYIAVVSRAKPDRVVDLIESEFESDHQWPEMISGLRLGII